MITRGFNNITSRLNPSYPPVMEKALARNFTPLGTSLKVAAPALTHGAGPA